MIQSNERFGNLHIFLFLLFLKTSMHIAKAKFCLSLFQAENREIFFCDGRWWSTVVKIDPNLSLSPFLFLIFFNIWFIEKNLIAWFWHVCDLAAEIHGHWRIGNLWCRPRLASQFFKYGYHASHVFTFNDGQFFMACVCFSSRNPWPLTSWNSLVQAKTCQSIL